MLSSPDSISIAFYSNPCHSKRMKGFLFASVFLFLIGLFGIPQINSVAAVTCSDGSQGIPDGGVCAVPNGDLCCSNSCPWNRNIFTPGAGRCAASSNAGSSSTPLTVGSTCTANSDCVSNTCYQGRCSSGLGNNASCDVNSQCASGYCKSNKCEPLPEQMVPQCDYFVGGFGAKTKSGDGRCARVYTPVGAIYTDAGGFVGKIFLFLLPTAGGIALLLIMRSGYKIMTARGNPEGVQQGREQLVAAIVGLMFIVFSFVFLQVIAGDLLNIPGFN